MPATNANAAVKPRPTELGPLTPRSSAVRRLCDQHTSIHHNNPR